MESIQKTTNQSLQIAVACGGTGGHIMPGLATARVLQARGHAVTLWLTGKAMEDKAVRDWDGPVVRVASKGLPTRFSFGGISSAMKIWSAAKQCRKLMRDAPPDVVLGMGSYASAGPVWAARKLGLPYVLHEANVIPGRAVRFFSRKAAVVACHFEETQFYLKGRPLTVTGMPLRESLLTQQEDIDEWPAQHGFTFLIMGGSGGAHRINETAVEALAYLARHDNAFQVIHLTGEADEEWVRDTYAEASITAWVRSFSPNMAAVYKAADLAVCRAGASTCAELALFAVPALLVPYPYAANDHQTFNARALEKAGAADVVPEKDLTVNWLYDYLEECLHNRKRLGRMSTALKGRQPGEGASRLADLVEQSARSVAITTS